MTLDPTQVPHIITGGNEHLLPVLRRAIANYQHMDFAVAFVQCSGIFELKGALEEALELGATIRILVGDYLGITSPDAMDVMLSLKERYGSLIIKVFATEGRISFHPKAYLFKNGRHPAHSGEIIIGSSNISYSALTEGIEWNLRIQQKEDPERFNLILQRFENLFEDPRTIILDQPWVEAYRLRRTVKTFTALEIEEQALAPFPIQTEALKALETTRKEGYSKGLVVLATGMGKTWLAGFDARAMKAEKILFLAHREEILRQAMATFQRIMPHKEAGIFMSNEKAKDKDFIFATVQSLGRRSNLHTFDSKHFDYIIIDEFHHAAANMYRRVMEYFEPKFLLGLTATPERSDTLNVSTLCEGNTVFEYHLHQGISEKHLAPFIYYGISDTGVDYQSIPWRNGQFEEGALENLVITQERTSHVLKEWQSKGGEKTIAFCVSRRHADFMAEYFNNLGFSSASVHSSSKTSRTLAVEDLKSGQIKVIFSVDIFNEGFDLPHIDTVMMLRPTESKILFLQQLGRGLRKHPSKQNLKVLDFIGNHLSFLKRPNWIFGENFGPAQLKIALKDLQNNPHARLPEGCEVNYDIEVIDFFDSLLQQKSGREVVLYEQLKLEYDRRPTASEFQQQGGALTKIRNNHGSWFAFVDAMGDLNEDERAVIEASKAFLKDMETTAMTKCFKMVLMTAILEADGLYAESNIEAITKRSWELFEANPQWKVDLREDLKIGGTTEHTREFLAYWKKNPINACIKSGFFRHEHNSLIFNYPLPEDRTDILDSMAREMIDLRIEQYFGRSTKPPQSNGPFIKSELSSADDIAEWLPLLPLDAAAGRLQGHTIGFEPESWIYTAHQNLPSPKEGLFVTKIKGDSMEPDIHDGDYALFSPQVGGTKNAMIVLVERNVDGLPDFVGELIIKRYRSEKSYHEDGFEHAKIILESLNPAYPPIVFEGESVNEIKILARYVGKIS